MFIATREAGKGIITAKYVRDDGKELTATADMTVFAVDEIIVTPGDAAVVAERPKILQPELSPGIVISTFYAEKRFNGAGR